MVAFRFKLFFMIEIVTPAFVLDREPRRELDSRATLYTKAMGLIEGYAKSARKTTSKLGSHLEPLEYVTVRIFKKVNFQITDALGQGSLPRTRRTIQLLQCLRAYLAPEEPDQFLWEFFIALQAGRDVALKSLLAHWGFDSKATTCHACNRAGPRYFSAHAFFICHRCVGANPAALIDYRNPLRQP